MLQHLTTKASTSLPITLITTSQYGKWKERQPAHVQKWLDSTDFKASATAVALLPGKDGALAGAVAAVPDTLDIWSAAHLPSLLPKSTYHFDTKLSPFQATELSLGWLLGCYQFTRYKKSKKNFATLVAPKDANIAFVQAAAEGIKHCRDLINTPTNDMNTAELAAECVAAVKPYKAKVKVLKGKELLDSNYPTIYTVGKGSESVPHLVDIRWGKASSPKVTLIGKGVCFDTGGLDIKPSSAMRLMKKDMAGAAIILSLATLIMHRGLDVNLRVLIPIVENSVSGTAMRPLDIIRTRKGITVEVGNTDAEGRLILCDALFEADQEKPEIIIDCATLTGAARVATGSDMPAFFTPDDKLAQALSRHGAALADPLYRLPLWKPYRDHMDSAFADISNDSNVPYAGAISAAMYLKEFIEHTHSWVHVDMMAWNIASRPGRPVGGEAQALRALYALLEEKYG